jgi:hypothetical protein
MYVAMTRAKKNWRYLGQDYTVYGGRKGYHQILSGYWLKILIEHILEQQGSVRK